MPPAEFELKISADERPQTYALNRAATVTGCLVGYLKILLAITFPFTVSSTINSPTMCLYPLVSHSDGTPNNKQA